MSFFGKKKNKVAVSTLSKRLQSIENWKKEIIELEAIIPTITNESDLEWKRCVCFYAINGFPNMKQRLMKSLSKIKKRMFATADVTDNKHGPRSIRKGPSVSQDHLD